MFPYYSRASIRNYDKNISLLFLFFYELLYLIDMQIAGCIALLTGLCEFCRSGKKSPNTSLENAVAPLNIILRVFAHLIAICFFY